MSKSPSPRLPETNENADLKKSNKPRTIEQNVVLIIGTALQDTVGYSLDDLTLNVDVNFNVNAKNQSTPAHNVVTLAFESEEIADQFFESIKKANTPELLEKIQSGFFKIGQKKNEIHIYTDDLMNIAALVEAIVKTSSTHPSRPKKAHNIRDLEDKSRVNARFLPTQFGFSSKKRLLEFYNKESQNMTMLPYGTFSYTPNDMRCAITAHRKIMNGTRGLAAHQMLMIH